CFVSLLTRPPPLSTLFPYTTLFRSTCYRAAAFEPRARQLVRARGIFRGTPPRGAEAGPLHPTCRARPRNLAEPDSSVGRLSDALDRKSTRLNSSHVKISYAVFCLKK